MIIEFEKTKIEINSKELKTLFSYAQNEQEGEKGGIILGKYNIKDNLYQINVITKPSKKDISTRNSYLRKKEPAQKIINKKWIESNGIINYMGEWHTHPCANPVPSSIDDKLMLSIIKDKSCKYEYIIMIIVGTSREFLN